MRFLTAKAAERTERGMRNLGELHDLCGEVEALPCLIRRFEARHR